MDRDQIIRASELGQYLYCAKAWWLGSVEGVPSSNVRELDAGTAAHEQHGQTVLRAVWLGRVGLACLAFGMMLLILFLVTR